MSQNNKYCIEEDKSIIESFAVKVYTFAKFRKFLQNWKCLQNFENVCKTFTKHLQNIWIAKEFDFFLLKFDLMG